MSREKTLGESRVRIDFNVTGNGQVDLIKRATAHLIDDVEALKRLGDSNITPEN